MAIFLQALIRHAAALRMHLKRGQCGLKFQDVFPDIQTKIRCAAQKCFEQDMKANRTAENRHC